MKAIKIENVADDFLNFELRDLVPLIDGEKFYWRILGFHSLGSFDSEFNVPEFEHRAWTSGFSMSWAEIRKLGLIVRQAIDCILIGDRNESHLKRYDTEEERDANCEIVLELIDGGFWEIHAKDPAVIARIVKHFEGNDRFMITEI